MCVRIFAWHVLVPYIYEYNTNENRARRPPPAIDTITTTVTAATTMPLRICMYNIMSIIDGILFTAKNSFQSFH